MLFFFGVLETLSKKAMLNGLSEELTTGLKNQWWHICLYKIKTPSLSSTILRSTCKTQYNTQWGSRSRKNGSHGCTRTGSADAVTPAEVVCCNTASSQSHCKAAGGQGGEVVRKPETQKDTRWPRNRIDSVCPSPEGPQGDLLTTHCGAWSDRGSTPAQITDYNWAGGTKEIKAGKKKKIQFHPIPCLHFF